MCKVSCSVSVSRPWKISCDSNAIWLSPSPGRPPVGRARSSRGPLRRFCLALTPSLTSPRWSEDQALHAASQRVRPPNALDHDWQTPTDPFGGRCQCGIACACHREESGAGKRTRTSDPRITNALLYQLSYPGVRARILKNGSRCSNAPEVHFRPCGAPGSRRRHPRARCRRADRAGGGIPPLARPHR